MRHEVAVYCTSVIRQIQTLEPTYLNWTPRSGSNISCRGHHNWCGVLSSISNVCGFIFLSAHIYIYIYSFLSKVFVYRYGRIIYAYLFLCMHAVACWYVSGHCWNPITIQLPGGCNYKPTKGYIFLYVDMTVFVFVYVLYFCLRSLWARQYASVDIQCEYGGASDCIKMKLLTGQSLTLAVPRRLSRYLEHGNGP